MIIFERINYFITNFFTLWVILFSIITYYRPEHFINLKTLIVPTLGVIMFGSVLAWWWRRH